MADDTTTETAPVEAPAPKEEEAIVPSMPTITAQESKTVGDDEMEARAADIGVTKEEVPAQVMQPREGDSDTVHVHEVYVVTDEIITDPSSPLAVQIPDAGRGTLDLPIHRLNNGTVEEVFAREASSSE